MRSVRSVPTSSVHHDAPTAANIASHLARRAADSPSAPAVMVAGTTGMRTWSFAELHLLSGRYAAGLAAAGVERGTRVLVMVTPGIDFVAVVFALFLIGAVPVLIDPGMGVRALLLCVAQVAPAVLIGVPRALIARHIFRRAFRSVQLTIGVGRGVGAITLERLARDGHSAPPCATLPDDLAAILFTSGSTGPAKGVMYSHAMLAAQVRALDDMFDFRPGDTQVATFPLFALFCPALGMSCVIPDMDASHPGRVDPARIVEAVQQGQATSAFGSPALWARVVPYCEEGRITLPGLRQVLIAGAPVPAGLIERLRVLLPQGEVYTPYGATEALPVCCISGAELSRGRMAAARGGAGICVGRAVRRMDVRVIAATDDVVSEWRDDLTLAAGAIGELVVRGPVVTREYFERPAATAAAKIHDGPDTWHRMGDVGYIDDEGMVWFCGRKAHRVLTSRGVLYSVKCEALFNEHPRIARSALVGVGPAPNERPVVVCEAHGGRPGRRERRAIAAELRDIARASTMTRELDTFLFIPRLPVDPRHNAKINRERLAGWARARV